jgi:hypothetical protein
MGEQYRGFKSERVQRSYYCINGHVQEPMFAAHIDSSEIPDMIDCPNCGMPAGQDKKNPPEIVKHEPYKTHLAYVKERRTSDEAKNLLDEALTSIRERRVKLAQEATKQARLAVAKAAAAKVAATKAAAAKAVKPKLIKKVEKPVAKKPVAKNAKPVAKNSLAKPAMKSKTKVGAKPASKLKASAKPAKKASKTSGKSLVKKSSKKK